MTDGSSAIDVRDVSKRYRLYTERRDTLRERFVRMSGSQHEEFWALKGVDFHVAPGETFGVIGQNGSGKSTLLRLMAGVHRPTTGSVTARGRVSALLELGAGFHPELTGRENVRLNGAILGLSKKYLETQLDEIAEFAGVEHFFDSPVKVYSSGMAIRLGFATAVHVDPDILLVDEAIAVGDEEFQRKCMEHLHGLRQRGTTIVFVSHSLGLVADLCENVLWLDQGEQRVVGPSDAVIDQYLADVNSRQETAAPPMADAGSTPEQVHTGTGEIRIRSVDYIDGAGNVVDALLAGQPCAIRLHYTATEPTNDVTFGLGFSTETGTRLAGPNSGFGDEALDIPVGDGVAEFRVDELLLQPGRYRVSVAAVVRHHVLDHVEAGYDLPVYASHAITEPGLVRMLGRWTHEAR